MIAVKNLSIHAGSFILENIHFEVPAGQCAVIMGRTGSGKTTLMETICGLRRPLAGEIYLNDRDVTRLKAAERGIGYVPQDGALFSTMKVREHLGFSLWIRRWPRNAIAARVDELSELLHITHLLHRKPQGLSGGEKRRVALGRALAAYPKILCLDEPLSALDDEMREEMHRTLETVQKYTKVTTLHVTHHKEDAKRLADVVLLLRGEAIQPVSPEELFFEPEGSNGLDSNRHAENHRTSAVNTLGQKKENP